MISELEDAWRRNHATNAMLLDAVPDAALADRYSPRTRTVASQFAHMHNVRVYQLKKRGKDLVGDLEGFGRGAEPDRATLEQVLHDSTEAVAALLGACERSGQVKSWNGPPASYLGYFLAHEAHHRGLVIVSCRIAGTKLPKDVLDGLWYWSRRFD